MLHLMSISHQQCEAAVNSIGNLAKGCWNVMLGTVGLMTGLPSHFLLRLQRLQKAGGMMEVGNIWGHMSGDRYNLDPHVFVWGEKREGKGFLLRTGQL